MNAMNRYHSHMLTDAMREREKILAQAHFEAALVVAVGTAFALLIIAIATFANL